GRVRAHRRVAGAEADRDVPAAGEARHVVAGAQRRDVEAGDHAVQHGVEVGGHEALERVRDDVANGAVGEPDDLVDDEAVEPGEIRADRSDLDGGGVGANLHVGAPGGVDPDVVGHVDV